MSKKTLISAVTATLVVGAASTTFAAANPFSDVPADSWAYDAVATLAADGVVDGYPDGTYKGQNTMTRYEMAQIIARAMAKTDLEKADKALVDKLAAEFAEELDNLGVRVADLEKKSDNVQWNGRLRYRYFTTDNDSTAHKDKTFNHAILRMEPKAYIGDTGWTANARMQYDINFSTSSNSNTKIDRAWVEGPLFGGKVQAGKMPVFTAQGLLMDDNATLATYSFGSDVFKTSLAGGRYDASVNDDNYSYEGDAKDITADYYAVQFDYKPSDKVSFNAGYNKLTGIEQNTDKSSGSNLGTIGLNDNTLDIWYVGTNFALGNNFSVTGEYADSDADKYDTAWTATLNYKGANKKDAGSWGMYAGYRKLGANAVLAPTFNDASIDQKGFVVGVDFIPAENMVASIQYFDGEYISDGTDTDKFFGQIDFFF